jgi:hypothetical protein
LNSSSNFLY